MSLRSRLVGLLAAAALALGGAARAGNVITPDEVQYPQINVTQILAGAGVSVTPAGGTGIVTISATGGGGNVSGSGSNGEMTFWTGANTVSGDSHILWNNSQKCLGIGAGCSLGSASLEVYGITRGTGGSFYATQSIPFDTLVMENLSAGNARIYTNLTNPLRLGANSNFSQLVLAGNGFVGVETASPSSTFTVAGLIESTLGGYKFPDGTIQTTASSGGGGGGGGGGSPPAALINVSATTSVSIPVTAGRFYKIDYNLNSSNSIVLQMEANNDVSASYNQGGGFGSYAGGVVGTGSNANNSWAIEQSGSNQHDGYLVLASPISGANGAHLSGNYFGNNGGGGGNFSTFEWNGSAPVSSIQLIAPSGTLTGTIILTDITSTTASGIAVSTYAAGVTGDIQINNGGSFAVDHGNFFWSFLNHNLGIGTTTPAPGFSLDIIGGSARTDHVFHTSCVLCQSFVMDASGPHWGGFGNYNANTWGGEWNTTNTTAQGNYVWLMNDLGQFTALGNFDAISSATFHSGGAFAGNVGIGTVSPSASLTIAQTSNLYSMLITTNAPSNAGAGIVAVSTTGSMTVGPLDPATTPVTLTVVAANVPNNTAVFEVDGPDAIFSAVRAQSATGQSGIFMDWGQAKGSQFSGVGAVFYTVPTRPAMRFDFMGGDGSTQRIELNDQNSIPQINISSNKNDGGAASVQISTDIVTLANGHTEYTGPAPSVTSCGAGAPPNPDGTDRRGDITTGTAATSCTLTFAQAWTKPPKCFVQDNSLASIAAITAKDNDSITISLSSALTGGVITYGCDGTR